VDLIQSVGVYATISVEQVGSYAGFAAVLGLAVLSALYFSQARDVKRLREWAGRAPERDAEARARVAAATATGQQRQAGAQPAAQPAAAAGGAAVAAQPATANAGNAGGGGGNSGGATATPAGAQASKAPAVAASASKAPAVAAGSAAGAGAASGGSGRPAVPIRPAGSRPSSATSILSAGDEPHQRWYRRLAPRYIALIVAGVLVVGGGIAVGAYQLLSSDDSGGGSGTSLSSGQTEQPSGEGKARGAALKPGDVSVAVLNATGVNGLANDFRDRALAAGFKRSSVGNDPSGQRAESVVLFSPGKEDEARLVRRKFDVNGIEPVDPQLKASVAPTADVILVVGADKTS
jgi:hypothetical protein